MSQSHPLDGVADALRKRASIIRERANYMQEQAETMLLEAKAARLAADVLDEEANSLSVPW